MGGWGDGGRVIVPVDDSIRAEVRPNRHRCVRCSTMPTLRTCARVCAGGVRVGPFSAAAFAPGVSSPLAAHAHLGTRMLRRQDGDDGPRGSPTRANALGTLYCTRRTRPAVERHSTVLAVSRGTRAVVGRACVGGARWYVAQRNLHLPAIAKSEHHQFTSRRRDGLRGSGRLAVHAVRALHVACCTSVACCTPGVLGCAWP